MSHERADRRPDAGFSMAELLVVVGIIATMAAVSLPAIGRYIRNYQIKGATQQVQGEVSAARLKAIMKNVRHGVAFVVLDSTRYMWVIEDDQSPPISPTRIELGTAMGTAGQAGTVQTLPQGLTFGTGCPGFTAANDYFFRFNRLGGWCDPTSGTSTCPVPATVPFNATINGQTYSNIGNTNYIQNNSSTGATLCIVQTATNLKGTITVAPGGRITSN